MTTLELPPEPETATKDSPDPTNRRDGIVGHLIFALGMDEKSHQPRMGRGNLAALRRMDPDAHDVPAFWRLLAQATDGAMIRSETETARWALVAHGMALMAPNHHDRGEIGAALQRIGYAEGRLARLLNARGPQFRALVPRLCRHLAAKQQPTNWYPFARLILAESRDEDTAEKVRRWIASYYYSAQSKAEGIEVNAV